MGTLVFQATLGGQVNLTGPNTASTFTISVPAVTGTMITSGDTATVTSTMISGPITTAKGGTGLTSFTANGVVYASSTSALATGSALTFDGTNFSTTGTVTGNGRSKFIGASEPFSIYLRYNGSTSGAYLGSSTTDTLNSYDSAGNPFFQFSPTADVFYVGGSEQMRLNSTGLGIGTSSPSTKLHVKGAVVSNFGVLTVQDSGGSGTSAYPVIALYDSALTHQGDLGMFAGDQVIANLTSTGKILFKTNSTTVGTLDSSGNLGLGVTPSAWGSPFLGAFEGKAGTALVGRSDAAQTFLFNNSYFNGTNYIRKAAGYANFILLDGFSGGMGFNIAGTSTAGSTASFTQAMTLNASGRLTVGETTDRNSGMIQLRQSADGYGFAAVDSGASFTAHLRADAVGARVGNNSTVPLIFDTNSVERARIDSSGNLLVGKTATGDSTIGVEARSTGYVSSVLASSSSANSSYVLYSTGAGAYRFYVDMGGTIHATSIVITAISDERLKENVRDLDTGISTIMALKPRRYDWKEGKGLDKKNAAGFIAQEFETVFPASVGTSKAGEDGIEYKNINYEELIPTLVKSIQEQQAIIESLKARLDAANL